MMSTSAPNTGTDQDPASQVSPTVVQHLSRHPSGDHQIIGLISLFTTAILVVVGAVWALAAVGGWWMLALAVAVHLTASAIVLAEAALAAAAVLTAVLATGVVVVIRRGTRARCPCFGADSGRPLGRLHLLRNLSLLAVVGAGLAAVLLTRGHPALAGMAVAAAAGALAALLFIRWEDLAELFAPIPQPLTGPPAIQRPSRGPH